MGSSEGEDSGLVARDHSRAAIRASNRARSHTASSATSRWTAASAADGDTVFGVRAVLMPKKMADIELIWNTVYVINRLIKRVVFVS